jgi:hypothetical protein
MSFLYNAHSYLRWIIVAVAIIALIRFLIVWMGKAQPGSMDRGLMSGFVGLLDLQMLLGIVILIWLGTSGAGWPRQRFEHGAMMLLAVILAHVFSAKWRELPGQLRGRNYVLLMVIVMALIFFGVMRLPQGWTGSSLPPLV